MKKIDKNDYAPIKEAFQFIYNILDTKQKD